MGVLCREITIGRLRKDVKLAFPIKTKANVVYKTCQELQNEHPYMMYQFLRAKNTYPIEIKRWIFGQGSLSLCLLILKLSISLIIKVASVFEGTPVKKDFINLPQENLNANVSGLTLAHR